MNPNQQQINQTAMMAGIVGQVGCTTALIIGLAFGGGFLLDGFLDTKPIFTILFVLGSVPVTLYAVVRVSLMAMARIQQQTNKTTEE